jgi:hypothetical protein
MLSVDIDKGIDSSSIEERRRVYGANEIDHEKPKTYLQLCWEAAQDSTLVLLEIAATVSLVLEMATANADHVRSRATRAPQPPRASRACSDMIRACWQWLLAPILSV